MRWPWEKKREPEKPIPALRAVVTDKWLSEYRGTVASGAGTRYALFTVRIRPQDRKALLEEGFRGVGAGRFPTHVIYCTHQIPFDQNRTRLLFNVVLILDAFRAPAQDKAALEITQVLRRQLEQCAHSRFVIRRYQENDEIDEYWLINVTVAYLSTRRRFERLGLTVDEATEIQ